MSPYRSSVAIAVLSLTLASCSGDGPVEPARAITLSVNPATLSVQQGRNDSVLVAIQGVNGFASSVTLSVEGVPPGGTLITEADGSVTGTTAITFTSDETSLYIVHATSAVAARSGAYTLAAINPVASASAAPFTAESWPASRRAITVQSSVTRW
jgi:hypothetical protein